jgi:signal peptidase I
MKKNKTKFQENFEAIVIAILLALFIRTFVVEPFKIPSGSMIPTLLVGDHILVNKFIYGMRIPFTNKKVFAFNKPTRGDVVVFVYPLDTTLDFIKRVIGVEGDTIVMKGKELYINGELYSDPYAHYIDDNPGNIEFPRGDFGPITVPKNSLFVLGDNRDTSRDSRFWGYVPLESVIGKAFIIYWSNGSNHIRFPLNYPMKLLDAIIYNRWSRAGDRIH